MGEPGEGYPWKWSIYRWLEGEPISKAQPPDLAEFAKNLAEFLIALERIDPTGGPLAGPHSFYRGGSFKVYDSEMRRAIDALKGKIDGTAATEVWEMALDSHWQGNPVWVHGDVSAGNLLVKKGKLCGVIDFGQLAIGDPASDLAIAWTLFSGKSRQVFCTMLPFDEGTWARSRGWTLWKALVVAAGFTDPNNAESVQCWRIINDVMKGKG
jgi:aminoglycoside phosphotransferase (APT) family kinase protein